MFLLAKLINCAFRAGPFLSWRKKLHHISYQSASNLSLWTMLKESLAREKTGIDTPGQHNLDFRSACGERNGICETDGQWTAVSGQRADFHPQSPGPVCINRPKDIRTAVCTRALGSHPNCYKFCWEIHPDLQLQTSWLWTPPRINFTCILSTV